MNRPVLALGTLFLLASGPHGWACSMGWGVIFDTREDLPADAEIRTWSLATDREFRFELFDSNGRVVPSDVVAHSVPRVIGLYYRHQGRYTVLRPRQPLAPGRYALGFNSSELDPTWLPRPRHEYRFTVVGATAGQEPLEVRKLAASVLRERCQTNTNPDCSAIHEDCAFVMLDFEDGRKAGRPVYEVSWAPRPADATTRRGGRARGFVGEPTEQGRRIRIPIWWLQDVKPTDKEVRLEVRALGKAGRMGPASSVVLKAEAVLAVADSEAPNPVERSLETRYATDIDRFRQAADASSAAVLALLSGEPSPPGKAADRAFADAALSADERLWIRGHVRGHETRTTVRMAVSVRSGRVHVEPSAERVGALVAALPLEVPEVQQVALLFYPHRPPNPRPDHFVDIHLTEGERVTTHWKPQEPCDLRCTIGQRLRFRSLVAAHPLFEEIARQHGRPTYWHQSTMWFGGPDDKQRIVATFEADQGRFTRIGMVGPVSLMRVGRLAPMLDAALAELGFSGEKAGLLRVGISVAEDGHVEGKVLDGLNPKTFTARLGTADVPPDGR